MTSTRSRTCGSNSNAGNSGTGDVGCPPNGRGYRGVRPWELGVPRGSNALSGRKRCAPVAARFGKGRGTADTAPPAVAVPRLLRVPGPRRVVELILARDGRGGGRFVLSRSSGGRGPVSFKSAGSELSWVDKVLRGVGQAPVPSLSRGVRARERRGLPALHRKVVQYYRSVRRIWSVVVKVTVLGTVLGTPAGGLGSPGSCRTYEALEGCANYVCTDVGVEYWPEAVTPWAAPGYQRSVYFSAFRTPPCRPSRPCSNAILRSGGHRGP